MPGAQYIGGADITRTDLPDVAQTGEAGQQEAKRDRAQEIAEEGRNEQGQDPLLRSNFPAIREKTRKKLTSNIKYPSSINELLLGLCAIRIVRQGIIDGSRDAGGKRAPLTLRPHWQI
jgi:hypothetical protein